MALDEGWGLASHGGGEAGAWVLVLVVLALLAMFALGLRGVQGAADEIDQLERGLGRLAEGDLSVRVGEEGGELSAALAGFNALAARLEAEQRDLEAGGASQPPGTEDEGRTPQGYTDSRLALAAVCRRMETLRQQAADGHPKVLDGLVEATDEVLALAERMDRQVQRARGQVTRAQLAEETAALTRRLEGLAARLEGE